VHIFHAKESLASKNSKDFMTTISESGRLVVPSRGLVRRVARRVLPQPTREYLLDHHPLTIWRRMTYDWLYQGGVVNREGLKYRLYRREEVSRAMYTDGHFEGKVQQLLLQVSPKFQSFIDCGANIGAISIPFGIRVGLPALAVEPVPGNIALLEENLRLNGLEHRVQVVRAALGEAHGRLPMDLADANQGDHRLWRSQGLHRPSIEVDVVTLDELIAENPQIQPPYLVKIDVQGYEFHVLLGARAATSSPILIVAEFWPEGLVGAGCRLSDFAALLRDRNLSVYEITPKPMRLQIISSIESMGSRFSGDEHCNILITNLSLKQLGLEHLLKSG
jgi:FkbM family methyltransferase